MPTLSSHAAHIFQTISSPELLVAHLAPHTLPQLCDLLLASPAESVNEDVHERLTEWENSATPSWSKTKAGSRARRVEIYGQLGLDEAQCALFDALFPPLRLSASEGWYTDKRQDAHDYYTRSYSKYLRKSNGFTVAATDDLEESTRRVFSRLADPESEDKTQTRGMVIGYVQSGKTTHFSGLIARAGDAGYRLIIVLAGTTDILRAQTQLRLDRQLVGLPEVNPKSQQDTAYADRPNNFFVDHLSDKEFESGDIFMWTRQTTSSGEYGKGRNIEDFTRRLKNPRQPFYASENLHHRFASAQIVVMKKKPQIINKLIADLKSFGVGAWDNISVLIIDDESDWASLNTKDTTKKSPTSIEVRTATNEAIIQLMRKLPRAQYIGYTATPYANVFINPEDEDGLYPKDY